jgi:hypothetical protein
MKQVQHYKAVMKIYTAPPYECFYKGMQNIKGSFVTCSQVAIMLFSQHVGKQWPNWNKLKIIRLIRHTVHKPCSLAPLVQWPTSFLNLSEKNIFSLVLGHSYTTSPWRSFQISFVMILWLPEICRLGHSLTLKYVRVTDHSEHASSITLLHIPFIPSTYL